MQSKVVRRLRLTGMIMPGDADKLRDILTTLAISATTKSDAHRLPPS